MELNLTGLTGLQTSNLDDLVGQKPPTTPTTKQTAKIERVSLGINGSVKNAPSHAVESITETKAPRLTKPRLYDEMMEKHHYI